MFSKRLRIRSWSAHVVFPLAARLFALNLLLGSSAVAGRIDPSDPPEGRFNDDWAEVYLAGGKAGYAHSTMNRNGDFVSTGMRIELRLHRAGQTVEMSVHQTTLESLDGTPKKFETTMRISAMKIVTKGTIKEGTVTITTSQFGMDQVQTYPFPKGSLMSWGSFRESLLRGFQPGTSYTLPLYAPDMRLDGSVAFQTTVGDWETFEHKDRKFRGKRVTAVIGAPMGSLTTENWVDENGFPLKMRMPLPGFGDMELITTDQATAIREFVAPEIFLTSAIKAGRAIDTKKAQRIRYRLAWDDPRAMIESLPTTSMQRVLERHPTAVTLEARRVPPHAAQSRTGGEKANCPHEYRYGNLMMNLKDPLLVDLAKRAAGAPAAEGYVLADRLRRFVSDYVRTKSLNVGFASANEVARTREGDCSEHGVLLAALGRLNGLPSRVVVGLAYVPWFGGQSDIFGYHLWTQFWIDGQWLDFDAALGESDCNPARIALATSSLHNAGLAELSLQLLSTIGSLDLTVLEVDLFAHSGPGSAPSD